MTRFKAAAVSASELGHSMTGPTLDRLRCSVGPAVVRAANVRNDASYWHGCGLGELPRWTPRHMLPALIGRGRGWVEQNRASLGVVSRPTVQTGGRAIFGCSRYHCGMTTTHTAGHPSAPAYAVLRVDRRKAKAMASIAAASGHQLRTNPPPNADPNAPPPIVMHLAAGNTPYQAAKHLLEGAERRNRDTVLCREIVLSASPSYFRPGREGMGGVYEPDRLKAWASAALAWAKRTWPDQLASMVLHADDEMTPHAHLLVVPRKQTPTGAWKLNSKALFDRERLRDLQTSFGEALQHLGIRRGEPGSQARHTEVRQFYGAIEKTKALPQRAAIPAAPKPPKRPKGLAAGASKVGEAMGIETDFQKSVKAHELAMQAWRETVKELRQKDAQSWDRMRAMAAVAPIKQRSQRQAIPSPTVQPSPKVQPSSARQRPR